MIDVSRLPVGRIGDAAYVLASAFKSDPILTYFLNGSLRRHIAYPAFFRAILFETWEGGHIYGATDGPDLVGVAIWAAPGNADPSHPFRRRAAWNHALVRLCFPGRSLGIYRGFHATQSLHPKAPHWYLCFVGVDPARQGTGVGRQLLAPVLAIADREHTLCYLETPFPATHEFYLRLGFALGLEASPFQGATALRTMERPPVAETSLR